MVTHSEGVAADVHDVAVVHDSIDERRGHDFVSQYAPPVVKSLVGGQHRGSMLVSAAHELEE